MDLDKQTGINVQEKSSLIWAIADLLRDYYKPHEYGKVILPMTVIKRFDDVLEPTKEKVLETYEKFKDNNLRDKILEKTSGYKFYNISKYNFQKLLDDSENIEENFRNYLNGFSENVQDILSNFEFQKEITKLANGGILYQVIQSFNSQRADMGADKVKPVDMGYIFEDLVRRFSESYNEDAGAHFTSRDIIYLMTDLLIADDEEKLSKEGIAKTVYDMTMGTSQMLTCMTERLKEIDKNADVIVFGQEKNPETFAIAKADMLIRGGDSDNMRLGNTLSDDRFTGYTFDYIISNPPFGIDWKGEKIAVMAEHQKGDAGRFAVGVPKVSDGQMLFDLNGFSKLKDTGRMAIIHNASSLFTGQAGSGESEIRKHMLENDWVEAIIQLPDDIFYNTGITTYIWIMSKNKSEKRRGKVQLIDASSMYVNRRKNIGGKRVDISPEDRDAIVQVFKDFENKSYNFNEKVCESKIFDNNEFGYTRIQIETPQYDEDGKILMKGKKKVADTSKRDYENVPMTEDIEEYFEREVKPYNPDAWIEKSKSKIGYEILFTRYFYKYENPESSESIAISIEEHEKEIKEALNRLFSEEK